MLLTMQAAYAEIARSGENNAGKMAHAVAQGALMGARGNSGVILSQLWRGFARGLDSLETMDGPIPLPMRWPKPATPPTKAWCARWKAPS
jgi:uncharacterized protein